MHAVAEAATQVIRETINSEGLRAIGRAICWKSSTEAALLAIQSAGLGVLTPNCVAMRYPETWRKEKDDKAFFVTCLSACFNFKKAALVCKGLNVFPKKKETMSGAIDVWWQREDGGLMLLFAQLLTYGQLHFAICFHVRTEKCCLLLTFLSPLSLSTSRRWSACRIRLFTLCYPNENHAAIERRCKVRGSSSRVLMHVFCALCILNVVLKYRAFGKLLWLQSPVSIASLSCLSEVSDPMVIHE